MKSAKNLICVTKSKKPKNNPKIDETPTENPKITKKTDFHENSENSDPNIEQISKTQKKLESESKYLKRRRNFKNLKFNLNSHLFVCLNKIIYDKFSLKIILTLKS